MLTRDEAEELLEQEGHVFDGSGHDVGQVLRVFLDEYTGWPSFGTVESSTVDRETFVALHEAELREQGDGVVVPYERSRIDAAPTTTIDHDLSISEEDNLFDYYRVPVDGVVPVVEHLGSVLAPVPGTEQEDEPTVDEHDVDRVAG